MPSVRGSLPAVGSSADFLPATLATVTCVATYLCLRAVLERALRAKARVLFSRPDDGGRTEGHVLARAALRHFDWAHTLRSSIRTWRQNLWEMEQLAGVLIR